MFIKDNRSLDKHTRLLSFPFLSSSHINEGGYHTQLFIKIIYPPPSILDYFYLSTLIVSIHHSVLVKKQYRIIPSVIIRYRLVVLQNWTLHIYTYRYRDVLLSSERQNWKLLISCLRFSWRYSSQKSMKRKYQNRNEVSFYEINHAGSVVFLNWSPLFKRVSISYRSIELLKPTSPVIMLA